MSIEVQNISKNYGEQKALDAVSFSVKKGEIVGFLGPNGAGKSTLMKILTTYITADSGEASVNGHNVAGAPKDVQKSVGYLPEHNPLYLDLYVREYLSFNADVYKVAKSRIDEVIALTGLTPESHKKIGELSKGYRQRVGLATALLHNPDVLILDEPTTGLDPNQLVEIRDLIRNIGKDKTVFLSTHIMQEVEAICDRVIIINNGKIVIIEEKAKLMKMLGKKEVKLSLYSPLTKIPDELKNFDIQLSPDSSSLTFTYNSKLEETGIALFLKSLHEHGILIKDLQTKESSLEEIFVQLVERGK